MKAKLNTSLIHLSSLLYFLMLVIGLFMHPRGPIWLNIILVITFGIVYSLMIICNPILNTYVLYSCFLVYCMLTISFVYSMAPEVSLFFFYSAFFIPFIVKEKFQKWFILTMLIAMCGCLAVTLIFYNFSHLFTLILFYVVIVMILIGNKRMVKNRKLKQELEQKNQHINVLIAEQERNRIGQDLHDTLGHVFASLSLKSELAMKLIDQDKDKAKEEIAAVNQLSKEALHKVRNIINDLKVQSFEEEVQGMEMLLENANFEFYFTHKEKARVLSPSKQSILAMILREALNNVIKHSGATKVCCSLEDNQETITLTVHDNGRGLDSGITLHSIEQRVNRVNGTLKVTNDKGLKVQITVPRGERL